MAQKEGAPLAELLQEYVDQTSEGIDDDQKVGEEDEDGVEQLEGTD